MQHHPATIPASITFPMQFEDMILDTELHVNGTGSPQHSQGRIGAFYGIKVIICKTYSSAIIILKGSEHYYMLPTTLNWGIQNRTDVYNTKHKLNNVA